MHFAFSDQQLEFRDAVRQVLAKECTTDDVRAAFDAPTARTPRWATLAELGVVGLTVPEAIEFQLAIGPAGELVREAGDLGVEKRALIASELAALNEKYLTPAGVIMSSSSWCVTAERPRG